MSLIYRIILVLVIILSLTAIACIGAPDDFEKTKSIADIQKKVSLLADNCWKLREIDSDSAVILGEQALALAEDIKFNDEIPRICNFIGVIHIHYLYDVKSSIPYFHKALETSLTNNDSIQIAYAYNNLGDAFMLTGNVPLALEYAMNSLNTFEKLDNLTGLAYGYVNLALVYRLNKEYSESLRYFTLARDIRVQQDDKNGLAYLLLEFASTYKALGNLDLAMEFYEKSYQQHLAIKNESYAAYSLNGIADIHYLNGNYEQALKYYKQSLTLNQERNKRYALIDDYFGLALVHAQLGNREEGEFALNAALEAAAKMDLAKEILKVHENFATFYQILNDYKMATSSMDKFLTLYDSLLSIQKFEILRETQNNFFIKQNLSKAQQELETSTLLRKYLIVIIVLLVLLGLVIVWRLRVHRKLNNKLKLANQSKDKLFSVISHDLKSPFNSILGFSDILIDNLKSKNYDDAGKYASIIYQSSKQNLNLLTNLLNWSRSQTGKIEFNPKPIQIEDLLIDLKEFFKNDIEKNKIDLNFQNEIKSMVKADPNILRVILTNLISNAFKYTKSNGEIAVRAFKRGNKIFISVEDNGIGMSEDTIKKLRSNETISSTEGLHNEVGTGLGLTICKELIEIHKGQLIIDSELNKGSIFKVEFPLN